MPGPAAEAVHKYSYKLRRVFRPRPMKHMAVAPRRFDLSPRANLRTSEISAGAEPATGENGFAVLWRGKTMAETRPWAELRRGFSQRVALVACSGPSLSLELLRRVGPLGFCIAVNGAVAPLARHDLRPDAYAVTDPDFAFGRFDLLRMGIESAAINFLSFAVLAEIVRKDRGLLRGRRIYLTDLVNHYWDRGKLADNEFRSRYGSDSRLRWHPTRDAGDAVGFSLDPQLGLFCGRTIGFRAVQIARFLGCRRIVLTGLDLNAPASAPRIYDEAGRPRPTRLEADYEQFILPSFEVAAALAAEEGWELINVSPGSRLPGSVIPNIDPMQMLTHLKAG